MSDLMDKHPGHEWFCFEGGALYCVPCKVFMHTRADEKRWAEQPLVQQLPFPTRILRPNFKPAPIRRIRVI